MFLPVGTEGNEMMNRMHGLRTIAAMCAAAWALAACGPGGPRVDQSDTTPPTGSSGQNGTANNVAAPTLTNNVATDGLNWINFRRAQVGMPALARNATIDIAAQSHSEYQRTNNVVTHDQTTGRPGFTGVLLQDRLKAAGYVVNDRASYAIGEIIAATQGGSGFTMAEELITAIYHRFVIFEPVFKEAGGGAASTSGGYHYFTADFVANDGYGPGLAAGAFATWPFSGQTQVPASFNSDYEEPDPVPDLGLVGYPVSVHTNLNRKLTVQGFTIHARGASGNLQTRLLVQGQDANTTTASVAAIVPLAPLASGTTYDVAFSGAIDGTAVSRSWSFTTK
jgi:uncharacterized protein YkwD